MKRKKTGFGHLTNRRYSILSAETNLFFRVFCSNFAAWNSRRTTSKFTDFRKTLDISSYNTQYSTIAFTIASHYDPTDGTVLSFATRFLHRA